MTLGDFSSICLHADVLCVENHFNYTLAGIGNRLFVYEGEKLQFSEKIFESERIHSIRVKNDMILLKGGRELALVCLEKNLGLLKRCQITSKIQCLDWIQDVILIDGNLAGLVTAHNFFQLWDLKLKLCLKVCSREENCILYSCRICGESQEELVVFSGTVFGDVLIWAPFLNKKATALKRIKAHNGAVFSIEIKVSDKIMTTTSDDRSVKIWSVITDKSVICPGDWEFVQIQLTHTLYGHTARVWRSLIISKFYVTIGEDSKLIIWSADGKLVKSLTLHQESGIRALTYSEKKKVILTGGEDGGINRFSWESLKNETPASRVFTIEGNFSTRVCFTENGIAYTQSGGCVLRSTTGEEFVYKNENFQTYCLMEVAPSGDFVILGSIKGDLVVIDVRTKEIVAEGRFLDGRVYSVHCLDDHLLTCGPNGRLDLWRFKELKNIKVMWLPNCRERWVTCVAIHDGCLIMGDRMGNVHVYDLNKGEDPVKSFRKVHSYLGVTDIRTHGDTVLTVGRDGTMKTFTRGFVHSLTHKLPIEWPWKILTWKGEKLILGFQSVSFVIWSTKHREIIASHDCGGGHRSCDVKVMKNKLTLLYVKEKKVFSVDLILDEITRMRNGFHGKEINCLRMLGRGMIVTGSEDTTLRISRVDKSEVEALQVLKTHISSIRAVSTYEMNPREILIASAGGKGQIVVWIFDVIAQDVRVIVNHHMKKETRNWKCPIPDVDPETRIMCLDITKPENDILVAAGCSDCQIRIFSYDEDLTLLCSALYTNCILNISFLKSSSRIFVASMGTDGRVVFWVVVDNSITQVLNFPLHQSGINSFQLEELEPENFVLATGGDDNLISISLVRLSEDKIEIKKQWENNKAHSCQITGMKILKRFLLTTSIDQRVTIWKWTANEEGFQMKFVNQYMSSVPDIQGMDARFSDDVTITMFVHGKGIEVLKADVSTTNQVQVTVSPLPKR